MKSATRTCGAVRLSVALSVVLLLGPARLMAADAVPRGQPVRAAPRAVPAPENVGTRIQRPHAQLQVTPDQEALRAPVAGAMQDNAKTIAATMQARSDKAGTMAALNDIMTCEAIAATHAAGLKRLAGSFAPLHAAMPPAQQRNAGLVFGRLPNPGRQG